MPRICYRPKRFAGSSVTVIDQANVILDEYAAQGFDLTLRQLFYQFVTRALLPNTQKSYKRLGGIISDARLAGLVDWYSLVDRTRDLRGTSHWTDPASIMRSTASSFRQDKWRNQPNRIEVWIEKDALIGVIAGVCDELDLDYFSCRGYTSQSEMWVAGQRLLGYLGDGDGQTVTILHLGDHDPSGLDMTRDIRDRLSLFCYEGIEVNRIALNMDQVREFNPPPNPAKITDSRAAAYIDEYGDESWELDALDPTTMAELIREEVLALRDEELWEEDEEEEAEHRRLLSDASDRWDDVVELLA